MHRLLIVTLLATLAGCTDIPELDSTVDPAVERQPFPKLQPQARILEIARGTDTDEAEERDTLAQASADLSARAEAARNARFEEFENP